MNSKKNSLFYSNRLKNVKYAIRGKILDRALEMERDQIPIIKLNIGNTQPFGLLTPDHIIDPICEALRDGRAHGYTHSLGIPEAREAIANHYRQRGIVAEEVVIGNGVSELVRIALDACLNAGDEVLIPSPAYPLWEAVIHLAGGTPVCYLCDESSAWEPDTADIEKKLSSRSRAIVVINPNNPTGAVYGRDTLQRISDLAAAHNLLLFHDAIYDGLEYDGNETVFFSSLNPDVLCVTFSGFSKTFRAPGLRLGWMFFSGPVHLIREYREGIALLCSLRLGSATPPQFGILPALTQDSGAAQLVSPEGRLSQQRDYIVKRLRAMPGISVVKPRGSLYVFPRIDMSQFDIDSDEQFAYALLEKGRVLVVPGTGFSWPTPDHFRVVFLPEIATLKKAMDALEAFLSEIAH